MAYLTFTLNHGEFTVPKSLVNLLKLPFYESVTQKKFKKLLGLLVSINSFKVVLFERNTVNSNSTSLFSRCVFFKCQRFFQHCQILLYLFCNLYNHFLFKIKTISNLIITAYVNNLVMGRVQNSSGSGLTLTFDFGFGLHWFSMFQSISGSG